MFVPTLLTRLWHTHNAMLPRRDMFLKFLDLLDFKEQGVLSDGVTVVYVRKGSPLRVRVPSDIEFFQPSYIARQMLLIAESGIGDDRVKEAIEKVEEQP